MNLQQLNQWLALAANLGVLASILFLATQIRQNSQMMEVQALTVSAANHVQIDLAGLGDNPSTALVKALTDQADMSDEEILINGSWLSANSWQFRNSYQLHQKGVLSDEAWQAELNVIAGYYGSKVGRAYWEASKVFYDRGYIDTVEAALQESGDAGSSWLHAIRTGMQGGRVTP